MKSVEIDIASLSPRVRQALEAMPIAATSAARRRSLEIAAILGALRADDDVVLAGALVPLLDADVLDQAHAGEIAGPTAAHARTRAAPDRRARRAGPLESTVRI